MWEVFIFFCRLDGAEEGTVRDVDALTSPGAEASDVDWHAAGGGGLLRATINSLGLSFPQHHIYHSLIINFEECTPNPFAHYPWHGQYTGNIRTSIWCFGLITFGQQTDGIRPGI